MLFAVAAGIAWGIGGYFEKSGLKALGLPPIAGITLRTAVAVVILGTLSISSWRIPQQTGLQPWLMIIIGGGIVAGSLGMWCFYSSLAVTENLGVTLAIAFACSPVAGTLFGLIRGDQPINLTSALGLIAVVAGIVLLQIAHKPVSQ